MAELGSFSLDNWGNRIYVDYDITAQQNNQSTYRRRIMLHVVNGGSVTWYTPTASFWSPNKTETLANHYTAGDHVLNEQWLTVQHDSAGNHTETIAGNIDTSFFKRDFSYTVQFPRTKSPATLDSFTGTRLTGGFTATYTGDASYTYKLRISIPYVVELQTFNNYVSGTEVRLSYEAVQLARENNPGNNIVIGGVIETWSGDTKVGESSEIMLNCTMGGSAKIRVNGVWKDAIPYVRINNQWKEVIPYIRVNNQWKEGI